MQHGKESSQIEIHGYSWVWNLAILRRFWSFHFGRSKKLWGIFLGFCKNKWFPIVKRNFWRVCATLNGHSLDTQWTHTGHPLDTHRTLTGHSLVPPPPSPWYPILEGMELNKHISVYINQKPGTGGAIHPRSPLKVGLGASILHWKLSGAFHFFMRAIQQCWSLIYRTC